MWSKLVCLALLAVAISAKSHHARDEESGSDAGPPNIIFIMGDDMGYHDLGFRNDEVISPNLDALAEDGIVFTNHYTQHVCTPSRASFMTGRYPSTMGMQHSVILPHQHFCVPLTERFLPQYLKDLGYSTHAFGKWHLGVCRWECTPLFRGFDTFNGGYDGAGDYYQHTSFGRFDWSDGIRLNYSTVGHHSQDLVLERAQNIIKSNEGEPMFMYVAFHNPHSPYQPKAEHAALFADGDHHGAHRTSYLALLAGMDDAIGQLIQTLKDEGKYDNSIIVFSSDNGADPHEGMNSPFRGGKSSLYEGGTKSATFVHSPLFKNKGEINGLMHISDWLPTLVSIASKGEVNLPDELDGIDQSDMLLNGGASQRTSMVYNIDRQLNLLGGSKFGEMAVRNEKYKLLWGFPGQTDGYGHELEYVANMEEYHDYVHEHESEEERKKRGGPYVFSAEATHVLVTYQQMVRVSDEQFEAGEGFMQLYNLEDDPTETNNLIDSTDEADVEAKQELIKMIQDFVEDEFEPVSEVNFQKNTPQRPSSGWMPGWCNCGEAEMQVPSDFSVL